MKEITRQQLKKIFDKSTKNRKIEILYDALDYMEQSNSRSQSQCIALAMGYTLSD